MTTTRQGPASPSAASNAADALDRLPPIPETQLTDAQSHAAAEFRALRQQDVFGPFVPLLRSPEVMTRVSALGERLRFHGVLPARLREFVILVVARRWTQQFEWHVHAPVARQAGLSEQTVLAIAEGNRPAQMADDEETSTASATSWSARAA